MNVYFLILGYGKTNEYYISCARQLSKTLDLEVKLIYLDNKSNKLNAPGIYDCEKHAEKSNKYYEFSGYIVLLNELINLSPKKNDLVILINDTATDHHYWLGWLGVIKILCKNIASGNIYGDLRIANQIKESYTYIASWMYILYVQDAFDLLRSITYSIQSASKDEHYYSVDIQIDYAKHLSPERREILNNWLFNKNPLRGWINSGEFNLMKKDDRLRKGLAIQIEHEISIGLKKYGINLVDIKNNSILGGIVHTIDRIRNVVTRLNYKLINK